MTVGEFLFLYLYVSLSEPSHELGSRILSAKGARVRRMRKTNETQEVLRMQGMMIDDQYTESGITIDINKT